MSVVSNGKLEVSNGKLVSSTGKLVRSMSVVSNGLCSNCKYKTFFNTYEVNREMGGEGWWEWMAQKAGG